MTQRQALESRYQALVAKLPKHNRRVAVLYQAHWITTSLTDKERETSLPENWEIFKKIKVLNAVLKQLDEMEEKQ